MPRLIDADKVAEAIAWLDEYDFVLWHDVMECIDKVPTVDAVEVVRCKDCKYYIADGCDECQLMIAKSIIASINNKRWYSDFYCAWGERKEDAEID